MDIVKKQEPAVEVISHDVTPLTVNTDAGRFAKFGWFIVLAGVVGFLIWASTAPLDKGVPMSGSVAKEGNRKTVQYLQSGIVQDILVKDGDRVKAGQVLVRMNDVQAKSALEMSRSQYITAHTTQARLEAELSGQKTLVFPAALTSLKDDPRVKDSIALQSELLASRRSSYQSEQGSYDENIAGLQTQVKGYQDGVANKKEQQAFLKEQLDNTRDLAKDGYIARNRLLDLERTYSQVNAAISEDFVNIGRTQRQIMEIRLRKQQRNDEYQKEVRSQLSDVRREADALESRLTGQSFEVAITEVRAPTDGVVVGSNVFTKGGVVNPGARLMEIVPSDDSLVVEGQLAINLIDKVHVGLPVELMFSAFNTNRTPHIPGELIAVAADRTQDERSGQFYYKVRARVTPEGAKIIAARKLDIVSGMPVEMFVKTGERTMMSYLMKPVFDRAKSSMSED
jgi:protease secretion system membrane fusion protein